MAVRPGDPEALHLYQLIGAPLLAVIQAEAQAAQTSADFIKRIGFKSAGPPGAGAPLEQGGPLGDLRIAEFGLERVAADGTLKPQTVRVPVLSMFPIPLMQVKHADFDFDVRVVTRVPLESGKDTTESDAKEDYLAPKRIELKGFLAPSAGTGQRSVEANIKVHVRMEQSDLPAGLLRLMSIMDQNVTATPDAREKTNGK